MFSGLFGPPAPKTPGEAALKQSGLGPGGDKGDKDKKGKDKKDEKYEGGGFDPTGLERAAKAAKTLNNSKFAKESLDLIQEQERTKQVEYGLQQTQYQSYQQQQKMDHLAAKMKEDMEYLKRQTAEQKELAAHQNDQAFRLEAEKLKAQKAMHEKQMQDQLRNFERQEEMRRKTIQKESKLREEMEMRKVAEEVKGRIKQEQENHDLHIANAKLKAEEDRKTQLESIKLAAETAGAGIKLFLSDSKQMTAAAVTVSSLALGIYTAKVSTGVVGRYIEARLGKPSLVRETSRRSPVTHPWQWLKATFGRPSSDDALQGVVLEDKLQERLLRVARSTSNTKQNKAPFRHLLLYGPPGTGKTLFAKGLARHSGLDYAILTGGDVAPLGRDGVTEIHKVFDFANASKKGLLLFIDEADAFLRKRSSTTMSEDQRNALNAYLYRTGEPTTKFMIVYASNQPEQFDWAVNDRIDEMVEFDLPGLDERRKMIDMYMDKFLRGMDVGPASVQMSAPSGLSALFAGPGPTRIILDEGVDDALMQSVAERTEGFSGREIAKLAIAWQAAAYGSTDATFTPQLLELVLDAHGEQKGRKQAWADAASNAFAYRK